MAGKLSTLSTVAVLAVIFACLERHVRSATSRFWKIGWFLIFSYFAAQLVEPANGPASPLLIVLDWGRYNYPPSPFSSRWHPSSMTGADEIG